MKRNSLLLNLQRIADFVHESAHSCAESAGRALISGICLAKTPIYPEFCDGCSYYAAKTACWKQHCNSVPASFTPWLEKECTAGGFTATVEDWETTSTHAATAIKSEGAGLIGPEPRKAALVLVPAVAIALYLQ